MTDETPEPDSVLDRPSVPAEGRRGSTFVLARRRLPGLALEAAMIVFAVLVALGAEQWREEREMRDFAARVRSAVETEIDANLEEMRSTREGLRSSAELLGTVLAAEDMSLLEVDLQLPDFSSAAWHAAQASQAAPHLDYAWVIDVGRAYESHGIYSRISDQVIDAMADLVGGDVDRRTIRAVLGRLRVLVDVHDQVIERLEGVATDRPTGER